MSKDTKITPSSGSWIGDGGSNGISSRGDGGGGCVGRYIPTCVESECWIGGR